MRTDPTSTSAPNQPPSRLRCGELLGRGVMTEVYRAHDALLNRPVAVKVYHPEQHPAARLRFDTEAHALARLGHPTLVSLFDISSPEGSPYLVLQLIDGHSLAVRLRTGSLPESAVVRMGAALAAGLAHAHTHDVVHRDVRPANILLGRDDTPCLTDFGVALLTDQDRPSPDPPAVRSAYAAPEQFGDACCNSAVDIYAAGLVLIDCLTGTLDDRSAGPRTLDVARPRPVPEVPPGVSSELADLLARMTAVDPDLRPSAAWCARRQLDLQKGVSRPAVAITARRDEDPYVAGLAAGVIATITITVATNGILQLFPAHVPPIVNPVVPPGTSAADILANNEIESTDPYVAVTAIGFLLAIALAIVLIRRYSGQSQGNTGRAFETTSQI